MRNLERVRAGHTSQGFYVLGADGTFYGYNNNRSIERVHAMLDQAVAKFDAQRPAGVEIAAAERAAWALRPPEGASIARVHARIRPLPAGAGDANARLGRDHLWITAAEARALAKVGEAGGTWPASLRERVARFHLLDNIRGEPDFWKPEEVRVADFTARRLWPTAESAGSGDGGPVWVEVAGRFEIRSDDDRRGFVGGLKGWIVIDSASGRVSDVRLYAGGACWGSGTWTPGAPEGRFPLKLGIVPADDEAARLVPPQAAQCGERYLRPANSLFP